MASTNWPERWRYGQIENWLYFSLLEAAPAGIAGLFQPTAVVADTTEQAAVVSGPRRQPVCELGRANDRLHDGRALKCCRHQLHEMTHVRSPVRDRVRAVCWSTMRMRGGFAPQPPCHVKSCCQSAWQTFQTGSTALSATASLKQRGPDAWMMCAARSRRFFSLRNRADYKKSGFAANAGDGFGWARSNHNVSSAASANGAPTQPS